MATIIKEGRFSLTYPNYHGISSETPKIPEVPSGQKLLDLATDVAAKTLGICYPSLVKNFSNRSTFRTVPDSPSEIQKKMASDIPVKKTGTRKTLHNLGLLKTPPYEDHVKNGMFIYWDPNISKDMYVSTDFFKEFNSNYQSRRLESAINFGQAFIGEAMRSIPVPQELNSDEKDGWRDLAVDHLHKFIQEIKMTKAIGDDQTKQRKLDDLQKIMESSLLKSANTLVVASGAEVRFLSPGQNVRYPTYIVGDLTNKGIIEILTEEAQMKFIELMKKEYGSVNVYSKPDSTKNKAHAQKMLEAYGLANLILNKDNLFQYYISSIIPKYAYAAWIEDSTFK